MQLVIWNKVNTDNIDVILLEGLIKVKINDKTILNKDVKGNEDIEVYNKMLDDIETINIAFHEERMGDYKRLSEEFLENLKTL